MKHNSKKLLTFVAFSLFGLVSCGGDTSSVAPSTPAQSTPNASTPAPSTPAPSTPAPSTPTQSSEAPAVSSSSAGQTSASGEAAVKGIRLNYNYEGCPDPVFKAATGTSRRFQLFSVFDENDTKDVSTAFRNIPIPEREGYRFIGWFDSQNPTDLSLEKTTNFQLSKQGVYDVYAQWAPIAAGEETTIIECEHTPELYSKKDQGLGYSGGTSDWATFVQADGTGTASNGAFLSYLYAENFSLDFHFYASKSGDVSLTLRYSNEFVDLNLGPSTYPITVNGTSVTYSINRPHTGQPSDVLPFVDVSLGTVHLNQGMNTINCTTKNNLATGNGTMQGVAPLLDCFKITATGTAISYIPLHN